MWTTIELLTISALLSGVSAVMASYYGFKMGLEAGFEDGVITTIKGLHKADVLDMDKVIAAAREAGV